MFDILQNLFAKLAVSEQAKIKRLNRNLAALKITDPDEQRKRQILDLNKNNKIWEICQNPNKYWFILSPKQLSESRFVTIKLIVNNPNYNWDWSSLSANMFLPIVHILKYPDLPWNYNELSARSDLTWELFYKHLDKPWTSRVHINIKCPIIWDPEIIKKIPGYFDNLPDNVSWEFIKHFNLIDGYCGDFVAYESVTWQHMLENPDWDWGICSLENKKDIPFKYIYIIRHLENVHQDRETTFKEALEYGKTHDFTLKDLINNDDIVRGGCSRHLQIPVKFILKHKNLNWDWSYFFYRPDLTENDLYAVQEHWNIGVSTISRCKNIPYRFYVDNDNYSWDWDYIYKHKKIDWNIANPNCRIDKYAPAWVLRKWFNNLVDYNGILLNPNIDEELFIMTLNKDINFNWIHKITISKSPFLTWDIIKKYKQLPWDFKELLKHPNIYPDIVAENYTLFFAAMR